MTHGFSVPSNPACELIRPPEQQTHFIVNSPHSGRVYPQSFLDSSRLSHLAIRKSEDYMVDGLVASASEFGIPMLKANFPRAFLDVNREPYELDPKMFSDPLPQYVNTRSTRVTNGLGTIAKLVAEGEDIYRGKLKAADGISRIHELYQPYHAALGKLLAETHVKFGYAVLLDCHSMPSKTLAQVNGRRADFVLGNRFGNACDNSILQNARMLLQQMGYVVDINTPYAGGFITEHYGRPENGLHALQIEINRGLYMDETRIKTSDGFDDLRDDLRVFFKQLTNLKWSDLSGHIPLAAE